MWVLGVELVIWALPSELSPQSCVMYHSFVNFNLDVPQEVKQSPYPSKHACRWRGQLKPWHWKKKKTSAEVSNPREEKRCHYRGGSLVLWSADSRARHQAALHARQWGVGEQEVRVARDQANGRRYQSMATLRSYSSSHWEATRELGVGGWHYQKPANSFSLLYPPTVQSQPSCPDCSC